MPLTDVELQIDCGPIPYRVCSFLREAEARIEAFQRHSPVPGFVPSDFEACSRVIKALASTVLVPGTLFCEWGSGFGVIASLAAMLDYDAYGIEVDSQLVEEARKLAADYAVPVEFICGSFIPARAQAQIRRDDSFSWLNTDDCDTEDALGLAPDDFGVIFAYPWPDEAEFTERLFEEYGGVGAVLITHHGGDGFRIRRKVSRKKRKR
jgi:hypothetical protein